MKTNHKSKILIILSIMLLLGSAFFAAPNNNFSFATPPTQIRILLNNLKIHSQPNEDSPVLILAQKGQVYVVVGQQNNFYEIQLTDKTGFVLQSYTQNALLKSPQKNLDTNATLTKPSQAFKLENNQFVKIENVQLPENTRIKLINGYNNKTSHTRASVQIGSEIQTYYFQTQNISPDGTSSRALIAVLLIVVCVSIFLILYGFIRGKKSKN